MSDFANPKLAMPRKPRRPKGDFETPDREAVYRIQVHIDGCSESLYSRPTTNKAALKSKWLQMRHLGQCFVNIRNLDGGLEALIHPDSFNW